MSTTEMPQKKRLIYVYIFGCFLQLMLMFGCSTGVNVQEIPSTANVYNEYNSLNNDLNQAEADQVNVLAPSNFKNAKESLVDAKKSLDNQKDPKDTLHEIATGRAYLKRANEISEIAHNNIEQIISARRDALNAGATKFYSSDLTDLDKKLSSATSYFEKNKTDKGVKESKFLQEKYLDLELKSIKSENLASAEKNISEAKKDGADKMAPQSLAIAQKELSDTSAYITANRHELEEIKNRSSKTNLSTEHLLKITQESKNTKKITSEELALEMEKKQNQVLDNENQLIAERNVTSSLNEENRVIQGAAETQKNINSELADEVSTKDSALSKELAANQALESKNTELETEKSYNEKFEAAQKTFTKNEAEVYRQGNILTIRLKSLAFKSSKADLKSNNYPLLEKVQKVIKDFNGSTVVVEGHTDSIGGTKANNKLSETRAESVKDYFVSNGIITEDKIQAVGFGFQKPLASNKSVAGRAQNRRVDILIKLDQNQKL